VGRLEVAVQDAVLVSGRDGFSDGCQKLSRLAYRKQTPSQHLGQTAPLNKLHGEIRLPLGLTDFVDLHDIGMAQFRYRLGFLGKTGHLPGRGMAAGQNHLESYEPLERVLPGLVDNTHAALVQDSED